MRIIKHNVFGELEVVKQEHIDYWCGLCQFPFRNLDGKCSKELAIQSCWNWSGAEGGKWHKQHECPFLNKEPREECRCNDFKTIEEAFKEAGLEYHK